jgi:hypothetical protein
MGVMYCPCCHGSNCYLSILSCNVVTSIDILTPFPSVSMSLPLSLFFCLFLLFFLFVTALRLCTLFHSFAKWLVYVWTVRTVRTHFILDEYCAILFLSFHILSLHPCPLPFSALSAPSTFTSTFTFAFTFLLTLYLHMPSPSLSVPQCGREQKKKRV